MNVQQTIVRDQTHRICVAHFGCTLLFIFFQPVKTLRPLGTIDFRTFPSGLSGEGRGRGQIGRRVFLREDHAAEAEPNRVQPASMSRTEACSLSRQELFYAVIAGFVHLFMYLPIQK